MISCSSSQEIYKQVHCMNYISVMCQMFSESDCVVFIQGKTRTGTTLLWKGACKVAFVWHTCQRLRLSVIQSECVNLQIHLFLTSVWFSVCHLEHKTGPVSFFQTFSSSEQHRRIWWRAGVKYNHESGQIVTHKKTIRLCSSKCAYTFTHACTQSSNTDTLRAVTHTLNKQPFRNSELACCRSPAAVPCEMSPRASVFWLEGVRLPPWQESF